MVKKKALKLKSDLSSSPPVMMTDTEGSDRETFEALSPESKEKFLRTMCGVVSEVCEITTLEVCEITTLEVCEIITLEVCKITTLEVCKIITLEVCEIITL